ncbi:unnamed protein product [Strongylus vulgaris]|uniref:ShKT domain-containing protein n=1 Tax=Strongylus vulgaris TaxID=40348 RepID=A0A3P7I736_STRVU|nr:unnamed protein product [Strongylus vulgaris]
MLFSCVYWVLNGFCYNFFYTFEQRRTYCGRTCRFC